MIKFTPLFINVQDSPILIVGEKPGNTRDGSTIALQGNRTGDFVTEAIGNRGNIILTNVVNKLYEGPFDHNFCITDGLLELEELIVDYKPYKIICLGNIASDYVRRIVKHYNIIILRHPSWVNRFKSKTRHEYIKLLQDAIDK